MEEAQLHFMQQAVELATNNVETGGGGPFGCVIVRHGEVLATGVNCVVATNDPTAHAEVTAIRAACKRLGSFQLSDCDVYTSCEPCPMCLAALYWSRCQSIYYGNSAKDAAGIGFDDGFLYEEIVRPPSQRTIPIRQVCGKEALNSFVQWTNSLSKVRY